MTYIGMGANGEQTNKTSSQQSLTKPFLDI